MHRDDDNTTECLCGCGLTPIKGNFLPGHDGKLHHILTMVVKGKMEVNEIPIIVVKNRKSISLIQNNPVYKRLINKAARNLAA